MSMLGDRKDSDDAGNLAARKEKNAEQYDSKANASPNGKCTDWEAAGTETSKSIIYGKCFRKWDSDGNGVIDGDELRGLLAELGWPADDQSLKLALEKLDKDNNGKIEEDEFLKWTEFAWKDKVLMGRSLSHGSVPPQEKGERRASLTTFAEEEDE